MNRTPWTVLCTAAFWNRDLCNVLKLEKLLHNYDWYSLTWFAWIHVLLLIWCPYMPSNCICLLPHSIWNARHAWTLALTLHSIMILHQREREPITSVHWACKHDVCSIICDLHNCLETQVLSATRYVKVSCKFINPPRHGSYGRLEEDKKVCL